MPEISAAAAACEVSGGPKTRLLQVVSCPLLGLHIPDGKFGEIQARKALAVGRCSLWVNRTMSFVGALHFRLSSVRKLC